MTTPLDPQQQRLQTDQSLQAERLKSDLVIAEHRADVVEAVCCRCSTTCSHLGAVEVEAGAEDPAGSDVTMRYI